jgi:hypothetical protein
MSSAHDEIRELGQRFGDKLGAPLSAKNYWPPDERQPIDALHDEFKRRLERAESEAERELALPATLLVGGDPQLFAEVDRLRSEGELRLSVVLPLSALLVLAVIQGSPWWLAGFPIVAVLLVNGVLRDRDSRSLIVSAIARDPKKSSSVVRFREWIDAEQRSLREHEQPHSSEGVPVGEPGLMRDLVGVGCSLSLRIRWA